MPQIRCYSNYECIALFSHIFRDINDLYQLFVPDGFSKSGYRDLLYSNPDEAFKEYQEMLEDFQQYSNCTRSENEPVNSGDFKQENINNFSEYNSFIYLPGLIAYDIF